jgi:hypothetical protein
MVGATLLSKAAILLSRPLNRVLKVAADMVVPDWKFAIAPSATTGMVRTTVKIHHLCLLNLLM